MKVLRIIEHAYEPVNNKYLFGKGGININTRDITANMATKAECYLMNYHFGTEETINGIHYPPHSKWNAVSGLSPKTICGAVKGFFKYKGSPTAKLIYAFKQIDCGYINKYIKKLRPDIVNVVGATPGVMSHIDCCQKANIPIVISLHGLNNKKTIKVYEGVKIRESELLKRVDRERIPLTVVSTGVKNEFTEIYDIKDNSNIFVVLNGIKDEMPKFDDDYRYQLLKKHGVEPNKKTVICSGAFTKNKTQIAVVRAWKLLPDEIKKTHQLIFTGREIDSKEVRNAVSLLPETENVYVLGFIPPEENYAIIQGSALNVVASFSEGFGRTIIEAMAYGVPTCTFFDLFSLPDIYNEIAMTVAKDRSDEAYAQAILEALQKDWSKEEIIEYSKKFSMDNCVDGYLEVYKKVLNGEVH